MQGSIQQQEQKPYRYLSVIAVDKNGNVRFGELEKVIHANEIRGSQFRCARDLVINTVGPDGKGKLFDNEVRVLYLVIVKDISFYT